MRLSQTQVDSLRAAVVGMDFARQVVAAVEGLHRLALADCPGADLSRAAASAEQIVIAEIVLHYRGQIEGLYLALRREEGERGGRPAAVQALATRLHVYYTAPLGVVLRKVLFADDAVFVLPEAHDWTAPVEDVRLALAAAAS